MTSSLRSDGDRKSPPPRTRPSRQRDAFFDNAKYLAIVLVGVGHAWGQILDGNRTVETLYRVLYTFHMPAFIVISGYFSRSFDLSPKRVRRLITGVVVPYVVFEVAYALHRRVSEDPGNDISLLDPTYLLWFLCALFVWRLTTPLWQTLRWPLPIALGIAALASVTPTVGNDMNMQRVLQFLPCFVLGLLLRPEHFQLVRRRSVRIWSVPVVAAALVIAWWSVPRMETGWFYRNASVQDTSAPWWSGPVLTLALFGCSVVLTACFFAWVPGRRMWFTALGAGTIYGYLLHGFLVKEGDYTGWFQQPFLDRPLGEIGLTVLGATAVTLLCTRPVQRVLRYVVEPRMDWAFGRDPGDAARGAGSGTRQPVPAHARRPPSPPLRTPAARRSPSRTGGSPLTEKGAHPRVLLGQSCAGGPVEDGQPRGVGVVRQVGLLDEPRAGGGQDPRGVRLGRLPRPLGEGQDDVLGTAAQRRLGQPPLGQRVVLHGVVQPGGRDLLGVAAAPPHALGDGPQVLGVRPARLVGLSGVGGAGRGLHLGQGERRGGRSGVVGQGRHGRHGRHGPSMRRGPQSVAGADWAVGPSRQISSSARSSLTSLATASIRCQAAPWKPPAT